MSSAPPDGGTAIWPPWGRKRQSSTSSEGELGGIPLADLRFALGSDSVASETPLVPAYPAALPRDRHSCEDGSRTSFGVCSLSESSTADDQPETDDQRGSMPLIFPTPSSSSSSSTSSSSSSSSTSSSPTSPSQVASQKNGQTLRNDSAVRATSGSAASEQQRELKMSPPAPKETSECQRQHNHHQQQQQQQQQPGRGFGSRPGEYFRGIAAEARAWRFRAFAAGAASRDDLGPVAMLLPEAAPGQRVGGPTGRGPLLRRLQIRTYGMLDEFVVVTITRPGPLHLRLRPDTRGLVVLNNFDILSEDPHTSCPRLGPVEGVGTVMPGDALVSVNRDVLVDRPFSECVKSIREASLRATVAEPCLLCFRRADPASVDPSIRIPPRSLEQEKKLSLQRLLEGGEEGLIDEAKLRGIASTGVPDAGGLRPVLWRFLLRCLPVNRLQWTEHLQMQRGLYARFVRDFIFMPAESVTQGEGADSRGEGSPLDDIAQAADTAQAMLPNEVSDNGVVGKMQSVSCQGTLDPLNGLGVEKMATSVAAVSAVLRLVENSSLKGQPPQSIPEQHTCEQDLAEISAVRGAVLAAEEGAVGSVSPRSGTSGSSRCRSHMIGELKPTDDDPLSNKESSEWAALWSDKELMHAIEQDVVRTMPDLAFYACRSMEDDDGDGNGNSQGEEGDNGDRKKVRLERRKLGQERRLAISRILFVHAKLNPAESYTQGMNEIVATLFFVLASDDNEEWRQHCEADTFFCFTNLMAEIRDVFIQSLDESESGLHGKMQAFSTTLRQHDPELADHIVNLALDPRYFALRWFTTLLSREFDLPDTIRLWDSLFASQDRSSFLVFVFVTLLLAQRKTLLAGDFVSNLQLLQDYPPTDVPEILAQSEALRLYSARGNAARAGALQEQQAREAVEGARQAAEQVNAAARRFWNTSADLAVGAAEKIAALSEVADSFQAGVYSGRGGGKRGTTMGVLEGI